MSNPFDLTGPEFLKLYALWLGLAFVAAVIVRWMVTRSSADDVPLDPYEIAYIVGGRRRVALLALSSLVDKRHATIAGGRVHIADTASQSRDAMHRRLLAVAGPSFKARSVGSLLSGNIDQLRDTLESQELLARTESAWLSRGVTLLLFGVVLAAGAVKISIGISRNRPVSFLVALSALAVAIMIALMIGPYRTNAGRRAISRLREKRPQPWKPVNGDDTLVALWGLAALQAHTSYAELNRALGQHNNAGGSGGSSCSSGSSCGGGGGCGGCGS